MDERIGFGRYQSCMNRGSVGRVSLFWLWWYGWCCCCLPTPLLVGESDHPTFGPPASLSLHLASSFITPAGSVHKSRGDIVVCMWLQLKRWCVGVAEGHSGDVFDLPSTLCKYDLR